MPVTTRRRGGASTAATEISATAASLAATRPSLWMSHPATGFISRATIDIRRCVVATSAMLQTISATSGTRTARGVDLMRTSRSLAIAVTLVMHKLYSKKCRHSSSSGRTCRYLPASSARSDQVRHSLTFLLLGQHRAGDEIGAEGGEDGEIQQTRRRHHRGVGALLQRGARDEAERDRRHHTRQP